MVKHHSSECAWLMAMGMKASKLHQPDGVRVASVTLTAHFVFPRSPVGTNFHFSTHLRPIYVKGMVVWSSHNLRHIIYISIICTHKCMLSHKGSLCMHTLQLWDSSVHKFITLKHCSHMTHIHLNVSHSIRGTQCHDTHSHNIVISFLL